jgi:hypothetical protein
MMSDRIIRDELLTSERYWAISNDAKLLYIHLILNADDTARFSGKNFTIRTACFPGQVVDHNQIERMLDELQNQDLIRLYMVDNERFVFIPRFKQRLRYQTSRFPAPPNEINDLPEKKSDLSQTQDVPKSVSSQHKRREEKRSKDISHQVTPEGFDVFWNAYAKKTGKQNTIREWNKIKPDQATVDLICRQAKAYASVTEEKYRKDPERWIKGRHWEDEIAGGVSNSYDDLMSRLT